MVPAFAPAYSLWYSARFLTSFVHYGRPKNFNTFSKTADLRVALPLSPTKTLMNVMNVHDCSLDQGVKTNFIAIYHIRFRGLARQSALSTFGAVQFTVKQASNNDRKEKMTGERFFLNSLWNHVELEIS